jgi:hypothetical protein
VPVPVQHQRVSGGFLPEAEQRHPAAQASDVDSALTQDSKLSLPGLGRYFHDPEGFSIAPTENPSGS